MQHGSRRTPPGGPGLESALAAMFVGLAAAVMVAELLEWFWPWR